MITYENDLRLLTDENKQTDLWQKAAEKHDEKMQQVYQELTRRGPAPEGFATVQTAGVDGLMHAYIDGSDVFKAMEAKINEDQDWAQHQWVNIEWYAEDGNDIFEDRITAIELADLLGFKKEQVEVDVAIMSRGYENTFDQRSAGTRHGEEIFVAPGNYIVDEEYRENLRFYLGDLSRRHVIPVRWVTLLPENEEETVIRRPRRPEEEWPHG
jgi:hypothetical protein